MNLTTDLPYRSTDWLLAYKANHDYDVFEARLPPGEGTSLHPGPNKKREVRTVPNSVLMVFVCEIGVGGAVPELALELALELTESDEESLEAGALELELALELVAEAELLAGPDDDEGAEVDPELELDDADASDADAEDDADCEDEMTALRW